MSFWGITELVEKIFKNKYDDYWFGCISEKYNFSMDFQHKYYEYLKAVDEFYKTRIQQASAKLLNISVKALFWC